MALVKLTGTGTIGELISYAVTEDATPLTIGDSSGSAGQITVTAKANISGPIYKRSGSVVGDSIEINDPIRGNISGLVTEGSLPGSRITLSAETLLNRLNTERTAKPYYGTYTPATSSVTTRTNLATNPERTANTNTIAKVQPTGVNALSRVATGGIFNLPFARVTWTTAETAAGGGIVETTPGITAGVSYTLTTYVRAFRAISPGFGIPAQRIKVTLRFYNASSVLQGTPLVGELALEDGQWTRVGMAGVAPATATFATLEIVSHTGASFATWKAGDTLDTTATLVEQGALGSYFSGATANTNYTDPETDINTVTTTVWTGTAGGSSSVATTTVTNPAKGYNATQGNYFRYLCELVGLPNVFVDPEFDQRAVAYVGWTGNVWTQMKAFAAAIRAEVALVDGIVSLRKPRITDIPVESIERPTLNVNIAYSSQFVQVKNYNSHWGIDEVVYSAPNVLQVATGEYTEARVTVPHFVTTVNNPQPVRNRIEDYTTGPGQYSVIDSQGLSVDPRWWTSVGGRIEVSVSYDDPNELTIRLFGASLDSDGYVGPFRIAYQYDENEPALDITATGVLVDEETIQIRTGVSPEQTSTVLGSEIDNPFITNRDLAYTRGLDAACAAAGPVVTLTGKIATAYVGSQSFGLVAGGRIRYGGNIFRVTNTSIEEGSIAFSAIGDMTFSDMIDLYSNTFTDFNVKYGAITFSAFNTMMAGKTFQTFNDVFGNPDFTMFNKIYAGASFSDHATYPYIGKDDPTNV